MQRAVLLGVPSELNTIPWETPDPGRMVRNNDLSAAPSER
jgi:hypothetical protein